MKTENIKAYITPKTTGYAALTGIGATVMSGITSKKALKRTHKPLACFTAALTGMHVGLIEYYHYKYNKNKVLSDADMT